MAARAAAAMSAWVLACPPMPQPPSGDSVISTQVRSAGLGSPAARGDDLGQLHDDAQLLFPVEHGDGREHLNAHIVARSRRIRNRISRKVMDKRSSVIEKQRDLWHTLPTHHSGGEFLGQLMLARD